MSPENIFYTIANYKTTNLETDPILSCDKVYLSLEMNEGGNRCASSLGPNINLR
jgi:hypothetical protein